MEKRASSVWQRRFLDLKSDGEEVVEDVNISSIFDESFLERDVVTRSTFLRIERARGHFISPHSHAGATLSLQYKFKCKKLDKNAWKTLKHRSRDASALNFSIAMVSLALLE